MTMKPDDLGGQDHEPNPRADAGEGETSPTEDPDWKRVAARAGERHKIREEAQRAARELRKTTAADERKPRQG